MKHLPRVLSIFIALSLFLGITTSSYAQQVSIVVSPPRHDIEAEPGEVIQRSVKVTNNAETTLYLSAQIYDFIVTDDFGTPQKVELEEAGRFAASNWITGESTQIILEPGESQTVTYIISVPQNALAGGHYAGAFFKYEEYQGPSTTVSKTTPEVGSLFSINVPGDITFNALIKSFLSDSRFYEYGPVSFQAIIENQSDTHIRPVSSIEIRNMIGRQVASLDLDEVNIFPFTSRTLEAQWDQVWGFGRYEAVLKAGYGPGHAAESAIYFWILPYRLIAAIAVVILLLIGVYISIKRHLHHRSDDRDQQIEDLKRRIAQMENRD